MVVAGWLCVVGCVLASSVNAGETIAVGGALVTIPDGWKQTVNKDDTVVLTPADLPTGVGCTFTLLGGETFDGSVKDRLTSEWKGFEELGRVLTDDGGKIDGEGKPVETAGRSGTIEM